MEIERSAGQKNQGDPNYKSLVEKSGHPISWNGIYNRITIEALKVPGEREGNTFNYQVHLSVEDVANILSEFGAGGVRQAPAQLRDALKGKSLALIRLLAIANGQTTSPIE